MVITSWTHFSKKRNSTQQPVSGQQYDVKLKEPTNVLTPTFKSATMSKEVNYIQAFGRYYYVTDVTYDTNDIAEFHCSVDVLATYKDNIKAATVFVERSDYAYNSMLPDPYISIENEEQVIMSGISMMDLFNPFGIYILSVLNNKGSGAGFATYYLTDASNMAALASYVNTDWGSAASDLLDWFQATFLHTAESIVECKWLPISLAVVGSGLSSETMRIGVDDVTGVSGYRFTSSAVIIHKNYTVSIPHRYTDFRKGAPYTKGRLFIPMYGMIDFNPLDFPTNTIYLAFDLDLGTGDIICYLSDNHGNVVSTVQYNVAVNCPVGQVSSDVGGVLGGIVTTAAGIAGAIATGGASAVASGIGAAAGAINTISAAGNTTGSIKGSQGGRALASDGLDFYVTLYTHDTTDPASVTGNHGRPLMEKRTLTNFTGYIKCAGASVAIEGYESEKTELNSYLNSGFFLE